MSRYIDADKLQEAFKELHGGKRSLLIDTAPTADVVEITRCKDCKYFAKYGNESYNWKTCLAHVGDTHGISENFYCRLGTRKGGER